MSNKMYDTLCFIAQIILPAVATLVFALGNIWNFESSQIVGTITAVDAFLGTILGISKSKYYKVVDNDEITTKE